MNDVCIKIKYEDGSMYVSIQFNYEFKFYMYLGSTRPDICYVIK